MHQEGKHFPNLASGQTKWVVLEIRVPSPFLYGCRKNAESIELQLDLAEDRTSSVARPTKPQTLHPNKHHQPFHKPYHHTVDRNPKPNATLNPKP